jgi:transcriptional regulator with XRE-family HTH domain
VDDRVLPGLLRRVRRLADMSQREMARASGIAPAALGRAEAGGDLRVSQLGRILGVAGLRLAVLDGSGGELMPMSEHAVRDGAGRLLPAHLDTRHGDDDWWGGPHRPRLRPPRYTFDRDRTLRDERRAAGVPEDHHLPEPGDSLAERAAARRRESLRRAQERREEAHRAWLEAGSPRDPDWGTWCTCLPDCEYVEGRNEELSHATGCPCCCDVC